MSHAMGTTDFPKNRALPAERPLELVVPLTVETTDLDYAGIVSNITYIRWLEYLRNRFFARYADPLAWFRDHIAAAVAETHILYLRPVGPSTALTGRIWLMEARHVDARLGAAITDSDLTPHALATQRVVTADWQAMRPVRLPEALVQAWETHRRIAVEG
ncbi:MAG: thioesterase family protein [Candidatus Hydrogenedentes bacterium]|nr:thioesterase family protein [Candidatus Hydrogenedentota bacterium]